MKKSEFTVETLLEYKFFGFTNGEDLNDWIYYYFEFEEVAPIKNAHTESGLLDAD